MQPVFTPAVHSLCLSPVPLQKDEAKAAYKATHISADSSTGRNNGAHFAFLEGLLARNGGGSGYIVGSGLTAADLCVWEIVDLHLRIFKEDMEAGVSTAHCV
jgi:glutathione S-transferase